MKNKLKFSHLIVFIILFTNCSVPPKKELLIGNWKTTLLSNLKTGQKDSTSLFMNVSITKDSLIVKMENKNDIANGTYGWSIKKDTIFVTNNFEETVHIAKIKKLTNTLMTVEMVIFLSDSLRVKYEKVNNN